MHKLPKSFTCRYLSLSKQFALPAKRQVCRVASLPKFFDVCSANPQKEICLYIQFFKKRYKRTKKIRPKKVVLGNTEKRKNLLYYGCRRESGRSPSTGTYRVADFLVFSAHDMRRREIVFTLFEYSASYKGFFYPPKPPYKSPGLFFSPFHPLQSPGCFCPKSKGKEIAKC